LKDARFSALIGLLCLFVSSQSQATLGLFEHGSGIKSLGYGGVSYVGVDETTALGANPAFAIGLGRRFDIGADVLTIKSSTTIVGNAAGPDATYASDGRHVFPIPQIGFTVPVAPRWAIGLAAFAAGFGPDYEQSPYARFASPQQAKSAASAMNSLKIVGFSLVTAHEVLPGQSIGLAVNLQHQSLTLRGATPFEALSESPDNVSDVGKHGALGIGFTVGWTGKLTNWLTGGVSYRSKAWTQRIEEYRGLLPDHGRLELPAIFGGGLQFAPTPPWRIATEFQRYQYADSHAFGNSIDLLFQGHPLGSTDGPGFGWSNQNVYKFGTSYQLTPELLLRAGILYGTRIIPRSQTLFAALAPATSKLHYTAGLTYAFSAASELSFYGALATKTTADGQNSIPASFGGGEISTRFRGISVGVSYGRHFGKRG